MHPKIHTLVEALLTQCAQQRNVPRETLRAVDFANWLGNVYGREPIIIQRGNTLPRASDGSVMHSARIKSPWPDGHAKPTRRRDPFFDESKRTKPGRDVVDPAKIAAQLDALFADL